MDISVSGGDDLVVTVSNDGPAISDEEREALFKVCPHRNKQHQGRAGARTRIVLYQSSCGTYAR